MKKIFYLIPALLLAGILFYACQENVNEPTQKSENMRLYALAGNPDVYQLYAGQDIDVGEIQVWNDDQNLYVKYVVDATDWCLTETHLAVAYSLDDIPQKNGNPIPGQFPYKGEHDCVTEVTYTIPLTDINPLWDCGDDLYIATHAVVQNQTSCLFETGTGIVYGMHRNTGDVYAIDVVNGTASFEFSSVAPPTGSAKPNGLAYDGVNQRMYYCTYQSSPTTLYFWDGTENVAGDLGAVQIADADFYNSKYYYITGPPASDDLYEVVFNADGTILSNTKIADIANGLHGWTFNGDIAIKDGVVYGWGRCGIHGVYEFFTYGLTGGVFNVNATAYQAFSMQLAFGSEGILYGHKSDASGNAYFYEVDITNGDLSNQTLINPDLAYTDCASGMICVPEEETAWGGTTPFPGGNWATYFNYEVTCGTPPPPGCDTETAWGGNTEGAGNAWWFYFDAQGTVPITQDIYAGQTINVGTVTYNGTQLVINLTGGWELQDVSESVKIEGYTTSTFPTERPPAGGFTYKGTDLTVTVASFPYYAIHLDVQLCDN